jgi:hypothetical protein
MTLHKFLKRNLGLDCISRLSTPPISRSIPVDLNDFISSPSIIVNPTGNSAILSQYPFSSFVFLEHNPVFDPPQIIPRTGVSLKFDFNFAKASEGDDEFGAFLLDQSGVPMGPPYEFFKGDASKGTVSFDLSSLSSDPIGLVIFLTEINSFAGMGGSSVKISNLQIFSNDPTQILIDRLQTPT